MENFVTKWGRNLENLNVQVYNQKLQIIYSGQVKGQDPSMRNLLDSCSLLFDTHDTSYFLKEK